MSLKKKKKKKHVPLKEKLDKLSFLKIEYIHSVKENQKTRLRPKKKKKFTKYCFCKYLSKILNI